MDVHVYELMHSLIVISGVVAAVLLLGPVGRAWARRLDRRTGTDPALPQEVERLRGQVEMQNRELMDLGERLDFAERMLSQRRDVAALPEGGK